MRAIDCPCGHHFEATDDQELFRACREQVDRDHPEMERGLRVRVEGPKDALATGAPAAVAR